MNNFYDLEEKSFNSTFHLFKDVYVISNYHDDNDDDMNLMEWKGAIINTKIIHDYVMGSD